METEINATTATQATEASVKSAKKAAPKMTPKNGKAADAAETATAEAANTDAANTTSKAFEKFAKTARAAKLSGKFHETAGFIKRKVGELTDDEALKNAGHSQQLVGKLHTFVSSIRETREAAQTKIAAKREEGDRILRKHSAKLLDVATEIVSDLKAFILH